MCLRGPDSPPEEGDFVLDGRQSVKWPLQQGRTGTITQAENLMSVHANFHIATDHILSVLGWNIFSSFQFFPTWPSFLKTHNQLGNASDLHRGRPWCYVFFSQNQPHPLPVKMTVILQHLAALSSRAFLFLMCVLSALLSLFHSSCWPFSWHLQCWLSVVLMLMCIQTVTRDESDHRSYHQVKSQGKGRQPRALRDIVVALCYSVFGFATGQSARQATEKSVSASNGQFWPKP